MAGKKINRVTDGGTVIQAIYADLAGALRMAESGLDLTPVGSITAATRVNRNTPVLVYNSTAGTLFVAFGDASVGAPAGRRRSRISPVFDLQKERRRHREGHVERRTLRDRRRRDSLGAAGETENAPPESCRRRG